MESREIFQEIERLMFLLFELAAKDKMQLIAYRAMVKAVRVFKGLVKRQDFKETI